MTQTVSPVAAPAPRALPQGGRRITQAVIFSVIVALLALLAFGVQSAGRGQLQSGPAPDFTLNLFDGGSARLSELRGKVVVVNIWASWCVPCRDEAPFLERAWRAYRERGVVLLGVDYIDTEPAARAFIQEFGITYPNGPDLGSAIYRAYRARGVPETYFVDRAGRIARTQIGPLNEPLLVSILDELLASQ